MARTPVARLIARCLVAVGIILTLLLAGAAPSDFSNGPHTTAIAK